MKNKFYYSCIFFLIIISLGTSCKVSAALIDTAEIVVKSVSDVSVNREMHIKGQMPSEKRGNVAIKVVMPNQGEIVISTDVETDPDDFQSILTTYSLFKQIETNNEGVYEYSYKIDNNPGEYIVYVTDENGMKETANVTLVDAQDIINASKAYNTIKNASKVDDVKTVLELYKTELGIDMEISNYVTNMTSVYNQVFLKRSTFVDVLGIVELYKKVLVVEAINEAKDASTVSNYVNKYKDILKINNLLAIDIYKNDFDDSYKTILYGHLFNSNKVDYDEFMKFFDEQIVLVALSKTQTYGEVIPLFQANSAIVKIDYSAYGKLADKSPVPKALYNKYFATMSLLIETFNAEVVKQANIEANTVNIDTGNRGGTGNTTVRVKGDTTVVSTDIPKAETEIKGIIFSDITDVPWAKDSIEFLSKSGAVKGDDNGNFNPNKNITREEFVKILVQAWKLNNTKADVDFLDVDKAAYYYSYVASAKQLGIVNGFSSSAFGIGMDINREEVATIVYRVMKLINPTMQTVEQSPEITDIVKISDYAKESILQMKNLGIISGYPDGSFAPQNTCTRAQAAKIIYSALLYSKTK